MNIVAFPCPQVLDPGTATSAISAGLPEAAKIILPKAAELRL